MNTMILSDSLIIVHVSLSKIILYPYHKILLILRRLRLSPSTYQTLLLEIEELSMVPFSLTFPRWFLPNPTIPPSFLTISLNRCLSLFMCLEQPLSRY